MSNKPMLIRIAPVLRTQAEEMAKEKGMTLSEWVRHMIVREIEANKKFEKVDDDYDIYDKN